MGDELETGTGEGTGETATETGAAPETDPTLETPGADAGEAAETGGEPASETDGGEPEAGGDELSDLATAMREIVAFGREGQKPDKAPAAGGAPKLEALTTEQRTALTDALGEDAAKPILAQLDAIPGILAKLEELAPVKGTHEAFQAQQQAETARKVNGFFDELAPKGFGNFYGPSAEKATREQIQRRAEVYATADAIWSQRAAMGKPIDDKTAMSWAHQLVTKTMGTADAVRGVRASVRARSAARTVPGGKSGGNPGTDPYKAAAREISAAQASFKSGV